MYSLTQTLLLVQVNLRCLSKVSLDKVTLIMKPHPPLQCTEKSVVLTTVG